MRSCALVLCTLWVWLAAVPAHGHEDGEPSSEVESVSADAPAAPPPRPEYPGRVDGHAPIGVMGDHTHAKGEWMVSYRYMRMSMRGNRDGSSRIGTSDILRPTGRFMVTPTRMPMEMHMAGIMYAPFDWLTLMVMVPYVSLEMDHETAMGTEFTTVSDGIGDVSVAGLVPIFHQRLDDFHHRLHLNSGLSIPTGTISEKDQTPMGLVRLPYPMQLGSGTVDFRPGFTYAGGWRRLGFGFQTIGTVRAGTNRHGYRLGNRAMLTGWGSFRLSEWLSVSLRTQYDEWTDIRGDDDRLDPMMVPTADPDLRAGRRVDLLAGINFLVKRGPLRGHRIGVEFGGPVLQDLNGPQLETDWTGTLGWQLAF